MRSTQPSKSETGERVHFRGLNSLRFLAALFVVIGHIPMNQKSVGLPNPHYGALFYRAAPAVYFFFTLSGFLITYLLLDERRRTGDIAVGKFYLRRICRIWPLYFLIVGFGLFFYNVLVPWLGIPYPVKYPLLLAIGLYSLLLPNLMNSLYTVGGILNPLWSIGLEEQYYLVWAPVVKRWGEMLSVICWLILVMFFLLFCLNYLAIFGDGRTQYFFGQIKFHFMAAGGLAALYLHRHSETFLSLPVFSSWLVQLALFALLLDFFFLGLVPFTWWSDEMTQLLLYPWLIVTVAANPRNIIPVENRFFDYLGTISYGVYMYHMVAVYATTALFKATSWWHENLLLYFIGYYSVAIGLTILFAHVSYRWFESPFLRLKYHRYSAPEPVVPKQLGPSSVYAIRPPVSQG